MEGLKKVSFGRYTENIEHYSINNVELENVESKTLVYYLILI